MAAMRAGGVDSLVMFLWHLSEPAANDLNNIPSAGGRIREPFRTNLINCVSDIRAAGFKSLTVNYGPQWTNNPLGDWQPNGVVNDIWDPQKLDENWSFIQDTRTLIKRFGPAETWFDPTMEMAPSDYVEQRLPGRLEGYIAEIYRRYMDAFGKDDLIFTVIGKSPEARTTTTERMDNLIRILRSTGLGMPPRFGVHPDQSSPTIGIQAADDALRNNGLGQPLVIGEMVAEGPRSASAARDIADFARKSDRIVPQVHLWWWRSEFEPHQCLSPPPPPPPPPLSRRLLHQRIHRSTPALDALRVSTRKLDRVPHTLRTACHRPSCRFIPRRHQRYVRDRELPPCRPQSRQEDEHPVQGFREVDCDSVARRVPLRLRQSPRKGQEDGAGLCTRIGKPAARSPRGKATEQLPARAYSRQIGRNPAFVTPGRSPTLSHSAESSESTISSRSRINHSGSSSNSCGAVTPRSVGSTPAPPRFA